MLPKSSQKLRLSVNWRPSALWLKVAEEDIRREAAQADGEVASELVTV
jgi:hypothetical protein